MDDIKEFSTVRLDKDKCKGCINCIKRCPTEAIRVVDGKARIMYDRCIACGECIRICQNHAKKAIYDSLDMMDHYKYKVAIPAPSLYGQFNNLDDIDYVLSGLINMGFDSVFEAAAGAEIISEITRELFQKGKVKKPVISSACPAVVELCLIRFHSLRDNLLPYIAPVDVAAKLAREKAIKEAGLKSEEIGIFFISPCPAKVFAVKSNLGVKKSDIDGVFAQSEIYMRLLPEMKKIEDPFVLSKCGIVGIGWASSGGEAAGVLRDKYLAADGIENCISVLTELEDGKFSDIDFVELNACPGGCVGGVLNIENPFIARAKLQALRKFLPVNKTHLEMYKEKSDGFKWQIQPEVEQVYRLDENKSVAIEKMNNVEDILTTLPGLDCGSCGAPSCRAYAEDIVTKRNTPDKCIMKNIK